ncbi:histidine kinase [Streptomyces sp. NPDC046557]|uniref:sensor histidine kinase n=1 Tax=Streptomyces sp. NPDC046557 TaxID=3155372 RepID=UPI0034000061
MGTGARAGVARLLGARARRRWVHLILGGALLMPYFLLAEVAVSVVASVGNVLGSTRLTFAAYGVSLPLAAVTAVFALVRPMSAGAVRALCGVPGERLAEGPARSWQARGRTSVWWTLHLGVGAVISGMSLAVPPMAVVLIVLPFVRRLRDAPVGLGWFRTGAEPYTAPLLGIALLCGLVLCAAAAGALLARAAPVLLGPTAADRLAAAEERAADLAVRNRLARELHDAVGHALSAVTLQANAARRVLDSDPGFVREALAAIEDTTRRTVGELDAVLGLLREGDGADGSDRSQPAPTLAADLDGLLARSRAAGTRITAHQDRGAAGDWARLPAIVSREAYRIVQEGLSNALRHGTGPVELWIAVQDRDDGTQRELEITMTNPPGTAEGPKPRATGGRGLRGAAERAALLGGGVEAGPVEAGPGEGRWRLRAVLPLGGDER